MSTETVVQTAARDRVGPGVRLNDLYEIDALIAVGGMGAVYRGHVIETGDKVAIKTIRSDFAENANALALFRKEATALHEVHHGAVVRYYVFAIDPRVGVPYLAMEYVTGESLADRLKRGPLDFAGVDLLRRRIADGLQAAHEAGIVHRDVSPDNVILPAGDPARAKVIDFGIARSTAGQTVIGDGFAGKYSHVSPEQLGLQGGDVTARSDIYSLGLVLAEASRGRPIDMGSSPAEFIARRSVVPDLTGVDARLVPLLETMLRPDPRQRPQSMADVAAWTPPAPRRRETRPAVEGGRSRRFLLLGGGAAGLAVAAVAAVAAFVLLQPAAMAPVPEPAAALAERIVAQAPASRPPGSGAGPVVAGGGSGEPRVDEPAIDAPASDASTTVEPTRAGPPGHREPPANAEDPRSARKPPPRQPAIEVPQPKADVPARRQSPPPEAQPDTKPGTPTQVAARPPEIGPSASSGPPGSVPTMERVAAYVRAYRGGGCFFLSPTAISGREAQIEAYGTGTQPFMTFDSDFKETFGFEAKIQLHQVDRGHCPVVDLLAEQAQAKPANVPKIRVEHDRIRSGDSLRGLVDFGNDRNVKLFLVESDGAVHDLAPYLKRSGRQAVFSVRLEAGAADQDRPQLLVAVASRSPIAAIDGRGGTRSDTVFTEIARDVGQPDSAVGLAVHYVKVGP